MDVMFYECYKEEEEVLTTILPQEITAEFNWRTIQESLHSKPQAKLISIRTQSKFPAAWGVEVEGVFSRSQGFDHLLEIRDNKDIQTGLGSLIPYCSRAVAEHAVMMMMNLMRKVKLQIKNFETFERNDITGMECKGKKAVVIGVGNIGKEIVDIVKGLRMDVKGVDIAPQGDNMEFLSLQDGVKWADVMFCAAPLTEETKGLLGYEIMKNAQPGIVLVNISRGELTPADDMRQLLSEGLLGGLALDVFPHERDFAASLRKRREITDRSGRVLMEMSRYENVIFTPHNAFNTKKALENKAKLTVEAIEQFLKDKTFPFMIS